MSACMRYCQRFYRAVWSTLMRILLLAQFFPPDIGGEERHVFNLANTLAERGHEVAVATQRMADVPDQETLVSGVRVHRFATIAMRLPGVYSTSRTHHPPLPDPLGVRELSRITRQERPHVVHAHNWIVNSAVALRRSSTTGLGFGLVLTLHDFSHVCATKRLMRMGSGCAGPSVARCLSCATAHYGITVGPLTAAATALMRPWKNRAIDHVVCVSNAVASGNHIPPGPNNSIIPNFVLDEVVLRRTGDVAESRAEGTPPSLPEEEFLLFVGELSRDKGVPTLLRAYESLGMKRPRLLLIGRRTPDTPAHLPDGAEMCAEWPHEHVMAAFRRCLFAVLPSICLDACPTTVLEAMASGRPVVATTTGGIADMIADGENGLLVPPGDEYKLAEAMARLLNDADLRARLAAGAQERVRRFTASAVVERLEAVYTRVAPRNSATSPKTCQASVNGGDADGS
jgi:glycosyltransferase involved in cell wall biosynthesis